MFVTDFEVLSNFARNNGLNCIDPFEKLNAMSVSISFYQLTITTKVMIKIRDKLKRPTRHKTRDVNDNETSKEMKRTNEQNCLIY